MSHDSWDWPGAFERAGKAEGGRVVETLKPEEFARALRSMYAEHGYIEKSDVRVQEFSRTGHLDWWDGRGRRVTLVREGGSAWRQMVAPSHARAPQFADLPDREVTYPSDPPPNYLPIPDGTPEGLRVQEARFDRAAAPLIKAAEERAIVAEQAKIDAAKPKGKKK